MGDVAEMLGLSPKADAATTGEAALNILTAQPKIAKIKMKKPKGMSREVFDLMRNEDGVITAPIPEGALPQTANLGFKNKRTSALKGKWSWEVIRSSSRPDKSLEVSHWVKAEMRHSDYPWTKFDVKPRRVQYTTAQYDAMFISPTWSREDTDVLLQGCEDFNLRWQVIRDRVKFSVFHSIDDMKDRYNFISMSLQMSLADPLFTPPTASGAVSAEEISAPTEAAAASSSSSSSSSPSLSAVTAPVVSGTAVAPPSSAVVTQETTAFSRYEEYSRAERKRRLQVDSLFFRTKENEEEEASLRAEIQALDALLKKTKQAGRPSAAAKAAQAATVKAIVSAATALTATTGKEASSLVTTTTTTTTTAATASGASALNAVGRGPKKLKKGYVEVIVLPDNSVVETGAATASDIPISSPLPATSKKGRKASKNGKKELPAVAASAPQPVLTVPTVVKSERRAEKLDTDALSLDELIAARKKELATKRASGGVQGGSATKKSKTSAVALPLHSILAPRTTSHADLQLDPKEPVKCSDVLFNNYSNCSSSMSSGTNSGIAPDTLFQNRAYLLSIGVPEAPLASFTVQGLVKQIESQCAELQKLREALNKSMRTIDDGCNGGGDFNATH